MNRKLYFKQLDLKGMMLTVKAFDVAYSLFCLLWHHCRLHALPLSQCTVAVSLSRGDADNKTVYTFKDTEGMYIYGTALLMHITDISDHYLCTLNKKQVL